MKLFISAIIVLYACSCSPKSTFCKINLGNGFFYLLDTINNNIYLSNSKSRSNKANSVPHVAWVVIPKIEYLGFNKTHILAINNYNEELSYWIIDKTQQPEEISINEKEDRILFSNVTTIDSFKFNTFKNNYGIKIHSKEHYKNKLILKN